MNRKLQFLACLVALLGLLAMPTAVPAKTLRVCQSDPARYAYRQALVRQILLKTQTPGAAADTLQPYADGPDPSQDRCLALLRQRSVDLVYLPPSPERLAEFDVIPFDLHQGLLGYRLLLIHRRDAARFSQVQSLDDLRQLSGGFGRQWSDYRLFELNRLPVVGASNAETLLAMLEAGRFHYFHRGLHEAWAELAQHADKTGLMVEPHLALVYHNPVYLMFNKADGALRRRFEQGLAQMRNDGSLQALFKASFGASIARAQLHRRRLIRLDTGTLPAAEAAASERPFWLN
jgi:hypothetical protein